MAFQQVPVATSANRLPQIRNSLYGLASIAVRGALPVLPAALTLGFIFLSFGANILQYMPYYDGDQFAYWHEMTTFALKGMHGGYYGVNELLSPLKGFGPHGIGIVIVEGLFYRLMPWLGFAAIPVMHLTLLTVALAGYVWLARPKLGEAVAVCLAFALYPPLILYLPTSYQEGFHYAAAVVLALVFFGLVKRRDDPKRLSFQMFSGVIILLFCLVRYTWALCFLPYFYILFSARRWRFILAFVCTVVLSLGIVWFSRLFSSAWYFTADNGVDISAHLFSGDIGFVLEHTFNNIYILFDFINNRAATAILASLVVFAVLGGALAWRQASWKRGVVSPGAVVFMLIAMNLLGLMAIFIFAWAGSGRHLVRLLSSHYLFCFLVTFHFFPKRVFHLFIAYNAILLPMYLGAMHVYQLPGYANAEARRQVETFTRQVSPFLPPVVGTHPWDETIFVSAPEVWVAFLGVPPGYGIQSPFGPAKDLPRRSRYAVTTTPPPDTGAGPWIPLTETAIGTLYRNPSPSVAPGTDKGVLP